MYFCCICGTEVRDKEECCGQTKSGSNLYWWGMDKKSAAWSELAKRKREEVEQRLIECRGEEEATQARDNEARELRRKLDQDEQLKQKEIEEQKEIDNIEMRRQAEQLQLYKLEKQKQIEKENEEEKVRAREKQRQVQQKKREEVREKEIADNVLQHRSQMKLLSSFSSGSSSSSSSNFLQENRRNDRMSKELSLSSSSSFSSSSSPPSYFSSSSSSSFSSSPSSSSSSSSSSLPSYFSSSSPPSPYSSSSSSSNFLHEKNRKELSSSSCSSLSQSAGNAFSKLVSPTAAMSPRLPRGFEYRVENGEKYIFCTLCGTYLSAQRTSPAHFTEHTNSKKHKQNIKQDGIGEMMDRKALNDTFHLRLACHYAANSLTIPSAEKIFEMNFITAIQKHRGGLQTPQHYRQKLLPHGYEKYRNSLVDKYLKDTPYSIVVDETPHMSRCMVGMIIKTLKVEILIQHSCFDEGILDGFGMYRWIDKLLDTIGLDKKRLVSVTRDNAGYMKKCVDHILADNQYEQRYPKVKDVACLSHGGNLVAEAITDSIPIINELLMLEKKYFLGYMKCARKSRANEAVSGI